MMADIAERRNSLTNKPNVDIMFVISEEQLAALKAAAPDREAFRQVLRGIVSDALAKKSPVWMPWLTFVGWGFEDWDNPPAGAYIDSL